MDWIQWLLSFIGVLGLIFFLFYALKKLNKGISVKSGNKLRVLDRVNLGRDGMLLVVSVCGRLMLLGATSSRVEKLCDLDITEEEYSVQQQSVDFKSVFSSMLGKNRWESEEQDSLQKNGSDGEALSESGQQKNQGEKSNEGASEKSSTTE